MKAPVILSWIFTSILCLWAGTLVFSLTQSYRPTFSYGTEKKYEWYGDGYSTSDEKGHPSNFPTSGHLTVSEATKPKADAYPNAEGGGIITRFFSRWDTNDTIALFTALMFAAAVGQWLATISARDTNRIQVRAYVSFSLNKNPDRDPIPDVPYLLIFNCENHGITPGFDVGFRGGIWHVEFDKDGRAPVPVLAQGLDEKRGNLFPGEKWSDKQMGIIANTRTMFTKKQIDDVKSGTHAFVIALRIVYSDVFGQPHETTEYWVVHYVHTHSGMRRQISLMPHQSIIT